MRKIFILSFLVFFGLILTGCQGETIDNLIANNSNQAESITDIQSDIADILDDIASLETRVSSLEDSVVASDAAISDLEDAITSINSSISGLEVDQSTADAAIVALETAMSTANDAISALNTDLATVTSDLLLAESDITTLSESLTALEEIVDTLSDQLSSTILDLQALGTYVDDADIDLQLLIDNLSIQYTELSTALAQLRFLTSNPLTFEQSGEILEGTLTIEEPLGVYGEDFVYQGIDITVTHPLTLESGASDLISLYSLDTDTFELTVSVPYHGLFNIQADFLYSNGIENIKYSYDIDASFTASHYNLTWLNATMPVLLFATDLFSGEYDEGYTYVEIERARTFDFTKLPEKALPYPIYASPSLGNYDQSQVPNFYESIDPIGSLNCYAFNWFNELYTIGVNSTFTFVGVDNIDRIVTAAYMSDIPENQFNIKMYTDGAYTTGTINTTYATISDYNSRVILFNEWRDAKLDGSNQTSYFSSKNLLVASKLDNFEYIVNNTSSWNVDSEVSAQIELSNIRVLPVDVAFQNVINNGNLVSLEYLLKTRWGDLPEESMESYFSENPEDNLLILGTSPAAEASTSYATFEKYIEYITANYGSSYNIFYKGHPRYPSDETRANFLDTNNVFELPSSIPVETLMLLYADVYVGGYTSTSFQSSLEGQTLFFFGSVTVIDNNATLADMISEGIIFYNTVYLIPDVNGDVVVE